MLFQLIISEEDARSLLLVLLQPFVDCLLP